jgi:hypothetical protein
VAVSRSAPTSEGTKSPANSPVATAAATKSPPFTASDTADHANERLVLGRRLLESDELAERLLTPHSDHAVADDIPAHGCEPNDEGRQHIGREPMYLHAAHDDVHDD